MSVIRVLARNEWLKTRKRPVFYVTLGLFAFIDLFGFGYNLRQSLRAEQGEFTLPRQWAQILGESSNVPLVFAGIVVILLIANEFSWRTARQNVIDGLSRGEWYWGKAIIAAFVVLTFAALHVAIGGGLAWIGTPEGATGLFTATQAAALVGFAVSGLGYAGLALLVATLVRSPGAAMAVWLFYVIAAEGLIRGGLSRLWESAGPYLEHLPVSAFDRARSYTVFDEEALATATARALERGWPAPAPGDPAVVLAVALAWTVGLALLGWLIFRRRDL